MRKEIGVLLVRLQRDPGDTDRKPRPAGSAGAGAEREASILGISPWELFGAVWSRVSVASHTSPVLGGLGQKSDRDHPKPGSCGAPRKPSAIHHQTAPNNYLYLRREGHLQRGTRRRKRDTPLLAFGLHQVLSAPLDRALAPSGGRAHRWECGGRRGAPPCLYMLFRATLRVPE